MVNLVKDKKHIFVHNRDLGFFTQTPITVQGFQKNSDGEEELMWCNHANADAERIEVMAMEWDRELGYLPTGTAWEDCWKCDKCDAYRFIDAKEWENAPFDGVYYYES